MCARKVCSFSLAWLIYLEQNASSCWKWKASVKIFCELNSGRFLCVNLRDSLIDFLIWVIWISVLNRSLFIVIYLLMFTTYLNLQWTSTKIGMCHLQVYIGWLKLTFLNILISFQKYLLGDTKKPWYIY